MNQGKVNFAGADIDVGNPRLLAALLTRLAAEAKKNFRTTEAQLMWMFSEVGRPQVVVVTDEDADDPVGKTKDKLGRTLAPRSKTRSDKGKKRSAQARKNIAKGQERAKVSRRLKAMVAALPAT
tara:strand:- start:1141 stop:1512 length:372 start_codon:yes stop_codon:yes gene_type:complete